MTREQSNTPERGKGGGRMGMWVCTVGSSPHGLHKSEVTTETEIGTPWGPRDRYVKGVRGRYPNEERRPHSPEGTQCRHQQAKLGRAGQCRRNKGPHRGLPAYASVHSKCFADLTVTFGRSANLSERTGENLRDGWLKDTPQFAPKTQCSKEKWIHRSW